jgi:hypothetical protein
MRRPALRGPRASGGGSARWGPVPARSDTPRRSGRARALDRPLLPRIAVRADGRPAGAAPPSSAAAGRGPVLPTRCLPQGVSYRRRASRGRASRRRWPPLSAGAHPPFQEGGEHVSASNAICHYKSPSRPRACRWAQRRGIRPYAAGLRALVRGRAAGKYVAALLPLLGQAGRHLLPRTDGRVGTAWGERRLEGDAPSGPTGDQHPGYRPITASGRALFPRPGTGGTAGERSL